jgi:hypothetical protein
MRLDKMNHKILVHKHIAAALAILSVIYSATYFLFPSAQSVEPVARLLLAASLLGFVSLPLFSGIALAVHARYSDSSLILGYRSSPTEGFGFLQAFISNTLEQSALQSLSLLAFCATAPEPLLVFAYAQVAAFLIGRAMFFFGYRSSPMHRLAGFAVGYYPSVAAVGASCFFALRAAA